VTLDEKLDISRRAFELLDAGDREGYRPHRKISAQATVSHSPPTTNRTRRVLFQ